MKVDVHECIHEFTLKWVPRRLQSIIQLQLKSAAIVHGTNIETSHFSNKAFLLHTHTHTCVFLLFFAYSQIFCLQCNELEIKKNDLSNRAFNIKGENTNLVQNKCTSLNIK